MAKLEHLDLDPELFRYQRAMNAGEGEAADAFTFKSDEAFVDFLLRAVTDEEDPRGLADVLSGYAAKLAQRGVLVAERDFVAGALELITPLTHAAADATAAGELARGARRDAEALAAALIARHLADAGHLERAQRELAETAKVENAADQDVRRLGAIVLELRRLVAGMRLEAAERAKAALESERDQTKQRLAAWLATDTAVAHRGAQAAADTIRELVHAKEEQAQPALLARDQAARALARALLHVAEVAERQRSQAEEQADGLDNQAGVADSDGQEAVRAGEQARLHLAAVQELIDRAQAVLRAAVDDGLLTAPDQVAQTADEAGQHARRAQDTLTQAWQRLPELTKERKQAENALGTLQRAERDASAEADRQAQTLDLATRRTEELAHEPRLAELLGAATVTLDVDASSVLGRLTAAVSAVEDQRAALQLAQAADERVLAALGNGGLLPASQPVTAALDILEQAGITAWAGWTYLAQLPADDRDQVLHRYPHLVDGLVLNNPDHVQDAERLLTRARLLPPAIVAVGTTATLQHLDVPTPAGLEFLLPPNPALYDEQAAEREREDLTVLHQQRATRLAELATQADADRNLAQRLRAWQQDYPPGELQRLDATSREATAAAEAPRAAVEASEHLRDAAAETEETLQRHLPELDEAAKQAKATATRLRTWPNNTGRVSTRTGRLAVHHRGYGQDAPAQHRYQARRQRPCGCGCRGLQLRPAWCSRTSIPGHDPEVGRSTFGSLRVTARLALHHTGRLEVPMSGVAAPATGTGRGEWMTAARSVNGTPVPAFVSSEWRWYAAGARRSRISHQTLELVTVLLAAAIPTAVALGASGAVSAVLGACLVLIAGFRQSFDWHENWIRFVGVSRAIEREVALFCVGLEPYEDSERAVPDLVRTVNDIVHLDFYQWTERRRTRIVPGDGGAHSGMPSVPA